MTRDPSQPTRIVCLSDYPVELFDQWLAQTGAWEVVVADRSRSIEAVLPDLAGADVVIGDAARQFSLDAGVIDRLERCRLIIQPSVGLDGVVDADAARARGIELVSAPGYNAEAVADWTVMAMLMMLRDAVAAQADLRGVGWRPRPLGRELGAVTVGLVGFGAVGRAVHHRLTGFGTPVLYTDSGRLPAVAGGATYCDLDDLVAGCDVLSLHAPLTDATRHLLDERRLGLMRSGSILINASRGGLVDERALVRALRAGRPAAAALDVFDPEPLPSSSELFDLDGVYLSPHVAAGTEQARQRVRALVRDALRRAVLEGVGAPPPVGAEGDAGQRAGARH